MSLRNIFEYFRWEMDVEGLLMSTGHWKDWNSRRFSLENDLDWFRALQSLQSFLIAQKGF